MGMMASGKREGEPREGPPFTTTRDGNARSHVMQGTGAGIVCFRSRTGLLSPLVEGPSLLAGLNARGPGPDHPLPEEGNRTSNLLAPIGEVNVDLARFDLVNVGCKAVSNSKCVGGA